MVGYCSIYKSHCHGNQSKNLQSYTLLIQEKVIYTIQTSQRVIYNYNDIYLCLRLREISHITLNFVLPNQPAQHLIECKLYTDLITITSQQKCRSHGHRQYCCCTQAGMHQCAWHIDGDTYRITSCFKNMSSRTTPRKRSSVSLISPKQNDRLELNMTVEHTVACCFFIFARSTGRGDHRFLLNMTLIHQPCNETLISHQCNKLVGIFHFSISTILQPQITASSPIQHYKNAFINTKYLIQDELQNQTDKISLLISDSCYELLYRFEL